MKWVHVHTPLDELALQLNELQLSEATLVKAFDPRNDAEAFAVPTPLVAPDVAGGVHFALVG